LLVSADRTLRLALRATLEESGYGVQECADPAGALEYLASPSPPAGLIADAQLGAPLWQLCGQLQAQPGQPPLIVLAYSPIDHSQASAIGATWLHLPLPLGDIVAYVDRLTEPV
jgi:DNA-binding response OmpR family regulator